MWAVVGAGAGGMEGRCLMRKEEIMELKQGGSNRHVIIKDRNKSSV